MANLYVRSTDGSDADNGTTWALAKATLGGAASIAAAGDKIYVSQVHAEATTADTTWTFPGTVTSPNWIVCGNDAAEPPTSGATTAASTNTTATCALTINGSLYMYGLLLDYGNSSNPAKSITLNGGSGSKQTYEQCKVRLSITSSSPSITIGGAAASAPLQTNFINSWMRFGGSSLGIVYYGDIVWRGGGIESGGTAPTTLFKSVGLYRAGIITLEGVDLSALSSTSNILASSANVPVHMTLKNCKLPASWSGSLFSSAPTTPGVRAEMYNCDSADTNYRLWVEDYCGSIKQETTVVRTSGASDGVTSLSWKMASSSNASYPNNQLVSPEIVKWNDTTGSSITATVEVVTDGVTLTDADCWIEVQYLGTSGTPLAIIASDAKASAVASSANQDSSSVAWTTTGLASPVKQKLVVSFTPVKKGYLQAVIKLAKASTTVYIDPLITIT